MNDEQFKEFENNTFGYGYGTGEVPVLTVLKTFFDSLEEERRYSYEELETKIGASATWLLINALCHADIIEYGTSPRFGFLSEKGEKLREYMKSKTVGEMYEILMVGN